MLSRVLALGPRRSSEPSGKRLPAESLDDPATPARIAVTGPAGAALFRLPDGRFRILADPGSLPSRAIEVTIGSPRADVSLDVPLLSR
jgi:hypothetical protein